MKIKAAVLREFKAPLSIEELELEPPKEKEVLIKHINTGFCHTDLHQMLGETRIQLPIVVGHETAGVVKEVGPGVKTVKEGDHVVSTFSVACGKCPECLRGMASMCTGYLDAFGQGTMLDGTSRLRDKNGHMVRHGLYVSGFSTHGVMPEEGVVPIRKDIPLDQACLMACCVPTGWGTVTNIANVQPGNSVAVYGLGGVGLNILRAAVLRQANPVIAGVTPQDDNTNLPLFRLPVHQLSILGGGFTGIFPPISIFRGSWTWP